MWDVLWIWMPAYVDRNQTTGPSGEFRKLLSPAFPVVLSTRSIGWQGQCRLSYKPFTLYKIICFQIRSCRTSSDVVLSGLIHSKKFVTGGLDSRTVIHLLEHYEGTEELRKERNQETCSFMTQCTKSFQRAAMLVSCETASFKTCSTFRDYPYI